MKKLTFINIIVFYVNYTYQYKTLKQYYRSINIRHFRTGRTQRLSLLSDVIKIISYMLRKHSSSANKDFELLTIAYAPLPFELRQRIITYLKRLTNVETKKPRLYVPTRFRDEKIRFENICYFHIFFFF